MAVAIYSVQPVSLLRRYGTGPIVGFAMLFSGIIITPWAKPFDVPGEWDMWTYIAFFNVVVLGTIISFNAYLEGVRRIGAVKRFRIIFGRADFGSPTRLGFIGQ